MIRRGAGGSALLPAIAMLSLLSLIAAMSLLASGADLLLVTRSVRARAAALAAEGALASALEEVAASPVVPEACYLPPHPGADVPPRTWQDGEWSCSRSVRSVRDTADVDADPATAVVLYDRSFGYAEAPRAAGGLPVLQVLVTVASGATRGAAVAEVTPVACRPGLLAAWTASGPLELGGDILVAGDPAEEAGPGGASPAILARGPVVLDGDAVVAQGAIVSDAELEVPAGALEALGAGATLGRLEDLPAGPEAGPLAGVVWSRGDWRGGLAGEGILIVHNPGYDPVRHEASRLVLEEGRITEAWDPTYSHLDPARRPAELRAVEGGEFRGVVIADVIAAPERPAAIVGAVLTLSRSPLRIDAGTRLEVRHSPEAVGACGRGPLRHLTAWRVLPAGEPP